MWTLDKVNVYKTVIFLGYIIHESAVWSDIHKSWFFLPRRASHLKYDETLDEQRATNIFFKCSEDFSDINVKHIGNAPHGYF